MKTMASYEFDDMRPHTDAEINAAMHRIAGDPHFAAIASYLFPHEDTDRIIDSLRGINSVDDFQRHIMDRVIWSIVNKSTTGLTWGGLDNIDPEKRYLFVSNHRDILLDSALLQIVLQKHGIRTTEITFGSNLMQGQIVIDIGRSNKMFRLERGGSPREFHRNSFRLSQYIRHAITEKKESVWIAQRNGRTKNGMDTTDQGLLKMLLMSGGGDPVSSLSELNIVPLSVSYQWEPCDMLKARETHLSSLRPYEKAPGEDLKSILHGIVQSKGNVHLQICRPVCMEDMQLMGDLPVNNFVTAVACLIDSRIRGGFRLWDTNYAALDLLNGNDFCKSYYTPELLAKFTAHMESVLTGLDVPAAELRTRFLEIYANPARDTYKV